MEASAFAYYHARCYRKRDLPNMQVRRLSPKECGPEVFCYDCLGSLTQEGVYVYSSLEEPAPDLPWEEIAANIQAWKDGNARYGTHVDDAYLESIRQVNEALRQGAQIAIHVYHHHFVCPPQAIPTRPSGVASSYPPLGGCLLRLHKVGVEFRVIDHWIVSRITLRLWDETHYQEVIRGAETPDPQWASMVQQAQQYMRHDREVEA